MQEIKPIKKKRVVLVVILALVLALLWLALFLFWPFIQSAASVEQLEPGLYSMEYGGDYGLDTFLEQGGASTDAQVAEFLSARLLADVSLTGGTFGCSTISVKSPVGNSLFSRNFDWQSCDALADTTGRSVVVEYVNNEMIRTDTPVVTNFYLAAGAKHGIGYSI